MSIYFEPDLSKAPKDRFILLKFKEVPYPLTGALKDDFEGGIVLILPDFEIRPDADDKEGIAEFIEDPDDWIRERELENTTEMYVNICPDPSRYQLITPPKLWKLIGWAQAWELEEVD